MPLTYDPEFQNAAPAIPPTAAPVHAIAERRDAMTGFFQPLLDKIPDSEDVDYTKYLVRSYDGLYIPVHRFSKRSKKAMKSRGPAILHCHGGGMIIGNVTMFKKTLEQQVQQCGVQVFSVDYRLAPEHPHPVPVEDCYAALTWLYEHQDQFSIDLERMAIMGESAGGCLAAGVSLLARDRGLFPRLAKQILIYPMLDDRNTTPNLSLEPLAVWKVADNITSWTALLRGSNKDGPVSQYAAPARAETVDGLQSAYIEVGDLDIFRNESIQYVARLAAAGVGVEFHLYPGVPHLFDILAPQITATKRALENRLRVIRSL